MERESHDPETGEVNGTSSERATRHASNARVQMERDRMGLGYSLIQDAVMRAVEKMPVWITATEKSGRGDAKYATLKSILEAVRPPLLEHGVRIRQGADRSYGVDEGGGGKGRMIPVYTDLVHAISGQVERTIIEIPLTRLDPQAMGSAITYGKRYSLLASLGLATDEADDDGERAKPRDVTEVVRASNDFEVMRGEIDSCKTTDALIKWGQDTKTKTRTNKLSTDEAVLLRQRYADRGREILADAE